MLRSGFLVVMMAFSSSAWAGNSVSFVVGGHRVHLEAAGNCRSTSCVSVSIPGIYEKRSRRDHFEDDADVASVSAKPAPAPQPILVTPAAPPASQPSVQPAQPVVCAPPPAVFKPPATVTQVTASPPAVQPAKVTPVTAPPAAMPIDAVRPAPDVAPRIATVSHEIEDAPETPLGDWQTAGKKGSVRIEKCGNALCGYVLDASSNAMGETVLVNMKPKTSSEKTSSDKPEWSGNVYSHDSGVTYYGTIAMKGPNTLRVEACALGKFFCSGNGWSRIVTSRERMITSTQPLSPPRS